MKRTDNVTYGEDGEVASASPDDARFRVEEELARGGIGRVLRAYDTHLERVVAIKALLRTSPAARARFERETRLTARLQHPNVVPVYDGGVDAEGVPFLAMRLVTGSTLGSRIDGCPDLAGRLGLLPHVIAACNAVAYAHHLRVAHRDLKPDNILVGSFGETLVIDWGLAKELDREDGTAEAEAEAEADADPILPDRSLTRVGAVMGTPAYMPPEQADGQPVGVAADVHALGAVLYQTLTGEAPYQGVPDVLAALLVGPPTPIRSLAPGAPPDLVAVAEKAMHRDPERRYPDAGALARDLERFAAGRFVDAHDYTWLERARRVAARNPLASALTATLVVGGLAGVAGLAEATRRAELARQEAVTLRIRERATRDAGSLDQARLLSDRDPRRALALLGTLSDDFPFDGRVRTVAAAALGAGVPTLLPPLSPEASVGGATWTTQGPVVAWGDALVAYDGDAPRLLEQASHRIQAVLPLGDGVVWCGADRIAWRTSTSAGSAGSPECALRPHGDGSVTHPLESALLQLAPDGTETRFAGPEDLLAHAGGPSGLLWVLDAESGFLGLRAPGAAAWTASWEFGTNAVYELASSPDGSVLALAGVPALTVVRLTAKGLDSRSVPLQADWTDLVAFVGPSLVAVGGADASIALVDVDTWEVRSWVLPGHPRAVVSVGPDALAVGTDTGVVVLVDPRYGPSRTLPVGDEPVRDLVASPDQTQLLVTTSTTALLHQLPPPPQRVDDQVTALIPQADGLWVGGLGGVERFGPAGDRVHVSGERTLDLVRCAGSLWAASEDAVVRLGDGLRLPQPSPTRALACDQGRGWVLAGRRDGHLVAYDRDGGARAALEVLEDAPGVHDLHVMADGRWLVAGSGSALVGDPAGGSVTALGQVGPSSEATGDAAGGWIGDLSGRVWRLGPDLELATEWASPVTCLEARDGGVLTGHGDGSVGWSTEGRVERMVGHTQYVARVAMRPGGRFAATASWDGTVWLWDLSTSPAAGRPLWGHADAVLALAWSEDGQTLWSGGQQGEIHRWTDDLPLDDAALRSAVRRFR